MNTNTYSPLYMYILWKNIQNANKQSKHMMMGGIWVYMCMCIYIKGEHAFNDMPPCEHVVCWRSLHMSNYVRIYIVYGDCFQLLLNRRRRPRQHIQRRLYQWQQQQQQRRSAAIYISPTAVRTCEVVSRFVGMFSLLQRCGCCCVVYIWWSYRLLYQAQWLFLLYC